MKKTIDKVSAMLQVLFLAPVKWPGKMVNVLKYIAIGVSLLQRALDDDRPDLTPPGFKAADKSVDTLSGNQQEEAGQ